MEKFNTKKDHSKTMMGRRIKNLFKRLFNNRKSDEEDKFDNNMIDT